MSDFQLCNVCQQPGTFDNALEVKQIPSNIRKFKDQKFTVWRCSSCRCLHSKELVDLNYYYENYVIGKEDLNYFFRCVYNNRLRLLRKCGLKKDSKLLDYGCNQGLFLSFLNQLGYENVFGYDPYVSKYSDQKVLSKKYDFITTYDVIEHVDEPRDFLTQLVSCLEKGGLLILGTPNADEIKLSDPGSPELHQPYHRHILSEKALINLASSQGLEVVEFSKRAYWDTLYPMLNTRLLWTYIYQTENVIDVLQEPLRLKMLLTSPLLIFYSFAGYFCRMPGSMTVVFRK